MRLVSLFLVVCILSGCSVKESVLEQHTTEPLVKTEEFKVDGPIRDLSSFSDLYLSFGDLYIKDMDYTFSVYGSLLDSPGSTSGRIFYLQDTGGINYTIYVASSKKELSAIREAIIGEEPLTGRFVYEGWSVVVLERNGSSFYVASLSNVMVIVDYSVSATQLAEFLKHAKISTKRFDSLRDGYALLSTYGNILARSDELGDGWVFAVEDAMFTPRGMWVNASTLQGDDIVKSLDELKQTLIESHPIYFIDERDLFFSRILSVDEESGEEYHSYVLGFLSYDALIVSVVDSIYLEKVPIEDIDAIFSEYVDQWTQYTNVLSWR